MEPHDLDNEKSFSKNEIDLEFLTKKLNEGVRKLNSYLNLAMQDIENSTNYYLKAAKLACDMLETVLYNEPFRASVRRLARFQNEYEDELIKTILKDLDDFFQKEFELLHYHQMPNADLILERGRENLSNIIEGKGSRPSQAIYMALLLRCKRQRAN